MTSMSIRRTLVKPSKTLQISCLDLSLIKAKSVKSKMISKHARTLYNVSLKDQSFAQIDQTRVMSEKVIHNWKEECTKIE